MAHVRKITHRPRRDGGRPTVSWQARWKDPNGKGRAKNFDRKAEAEAHLAGLAAAGGSSTMTIRQLGEAHHSYFAALVRAGQREQATLDGYKTALDVHLANDRDFAKVRLCDLTTPRVQQHLTEVFLRTGSLGVVGKQRRALVRWCKHGQQNGWLAANVAAATEIEKPSDRPEENEERVVIPPKADLAAVLRAAEEGAQAARDTAMVRLLLFAGLRASELLGLADDAVAATRKGTDVHVRERLERRYGVLGKVKSGAGRRDIPIGPQAALAVRAWRLQRGPARAFVSAAPATRGELVRGRLFPAPDGAPLWSYQAMLRQMWRPLMKRAGLLRMVPDAKGKNRPVVAFTPHALRHAFASIHIENGVDPKRLQKLMGHSTLALTMDLYGHLWRDEDRDEAMVAAAERTITRNTA